MMAITTIAFVVLVTYIAVKNGITSGANDSLSGL
jgi:hypothetical protein